MTKPESRAALLRIRDKLIRMGAELPVKVEGSPESAMKIGHSHALLLVDEELAALDAPCEVFPVDEDVRYFCRACGTKWVGDKLTRIAGAREVVGVHCGGKMEKVKP